MSGCARKIVGFQPAADNLQLFLRDLKITTASVTIFPFVNMN